MRVKICGLTRAQDAQYAEACGAWALGFIFYPPSSRYVTPEAVESILQNLQGSALTVGVFVNQTEAAAQIAAQLKLGAVQLHGTETPAECRWLRENFSGKIIKTFHLTSEDDLPRLGDYADCADDALVDAAVAGSWGGTGKTADWTLAVRAKEYSLPLILSGGLGPDNIAAGIAAVRPAGVDLASGVEDAPGIKNHAKINALFTAVRENAS